VELVIDTNILFSALLKRGSNEFQIVKSGKIGDQQYAQMSGTSVNDYTGIRPEDWKIGKDSILVPTSDIQQIDIFTKLKNKYVPISDIQQNDTFTKLKNK